MAGSVASSYQQDGYVVVRGVLDGVAVAACLAHLEDMQTCAGRVGPILMAPPERDDFLRALAADRQLSDLARALLAAEPVPFGCTYFVKQPRCGLPVLWHQDGYPWSTRLGIREAVTLWIALDAADDANGGLRVIPRSHVLAAQPLQASADEPNVFGAEIAPGLVDATLARPLALGPGDVSAHHPNLIHGSLANRSERPRRALAIRYRAGRRLLVGGSGADRR